MEEAERLCDRVALIDAGRLAVVDTATRSWPTSSAWSRPAWRTCSSLVAMPTALAGDREMGSCAASGRRQRTTPAGPGRVLAAQLLINVAVAVVSVTLILVVARLGYSVFLPRQLAGWVPAPLFTLAALLAIGLRPARSRTAGSTALFLQPTPDTLAGDPADRGAWDQWPQSSRTCSRLAWLRQP